MTAQGEENHRQATQELRISIATVIKANEGHSGVAEERWGHTEENLDVSR